MNDDQLLRYSRHILLEEFGIEGQQRVCDAHVLIVGVGGLGSPAALYLAASGIGRLTLVDDDLVDLTNLQRQILHGTPDVGSAKTASSSVALHRLNPDVVIHAIPERVDGMRIAALVADADVVLDCSDNFATRHAINQACVVAEVPLVSGAALGFNGQLASFDLRRPQDTSRRSPCYACLFPQSDDVEEITCATFGVFAPLTGIIGVMQAAEALKFVIGLQTMSGRLLLFDARQMDWHSVVVERDIKCLSCGDEKLGANG